MREKYFTAVFWWNIPDNKEQNKHTATYNKLKAKSDPEEQRTAFIIKNSQLPIQCFTLPFSEAMYAVTNSLVVFSSYVNTFFMVQTEQFN